MAKIVQKFIFVAFIIVTLAPFKGKLYILIDGGGASTTPSSNTFFR